MTSHAVSAEIERWTPQMARDILKLQDESLHRPIKASLVERYARDMATGKWEMNGETIIMNGKTVLDGRHRLSAVVKADLPISFLVVRGVAKDCFKSVDSGGLRTPGDVFRIAGIQHANIIAAAGRLCFAYDNIGTMQVQPWTGPTRSELLAYVQANHEHFMSAARWVGARPERKALTSPSLLAAMQVLCVNCEERNELFFDPLISGVGLSANAPVYVLRERLLRERTMRARLPTYVLAALCIKAWNAEQGGESMRLLRWNENEGFPELITRPPMGVTR